MKQATALVLFGLPLLLAAQTPAPAPAVAWRGAVWGSAAGSDRQTADGSLFLNNVAAGEGRFALDGLQLGADVALARGWSLKFTVLAGRTAQVLNDANLETGALAYPEAMLIWTGGNDTFKFGRMWTAMGMEVMDQAANLAATRGLLFTYAIPYNQVGVNWHHAVGSSWSTDVWLSNGEDRVKDNNRGKTLGVGLTYNHGGAADKFVNLMAFSGAEQDGFGPAAQGGAEGRKRNRVCSTFGWSWGGTTLAGELERAEETFAAGAIRGAPAGAAKATWSGAGVALKQQVSAQWAIFLRGELLKDDQGVRLNYDPTAAAAWASRDDADLQATSWCVGVERKWGSTYTRFELRRDRLNKEVQDRENKAFRDSTSATWSLGTTF